MPDSGSSTEPVCEPGDLTVTVRWDSDGNGGLRGEVIAENVGGRACRLPGKPTVTPIGPDGTPLPVQTVVTMEWLQPGYVTLPPGGRAAAPVHWLSWCGQRASDRARISWDDHSAIAAVHGPLQPECTAGKPDNLSSSWFRLTDLPGVDRRAATLRCRPNDRGAMMDPWTVSVRMRDRQTWPGWPGC
jgi:hypothetical protein